MAIWRLCLQWLETKELCLAYWVWMMMLLPDKSRGRQCTQRQSPPSSTSHQSKKESRSENEKFPARISCYYQSFYKYISSRCAILCFSYCYSLLRLRIRTHRLSDLGSELVMASCYCKKNACGFVIFCLLQMHLFIIFNLRMIDGKYKGDLDENRRLFSNYANISKIVFETD